MLKWKSSMHKVRILSHAKLDLWNIYSYISDDSVEFATKVILQIHKTIWYLKNFPYMGTTYEWGLRKIVDTKYKYSIYYFFEEDVVYVEKIIKHQNY